MEKQASNTFTAGMNTDRHPLTSQKTEVIDAMNIDLLTVGEGYQLILQKREGNAELLFTPNAWDADTTYHINEFVLYNNIIYKSKGVSTKGSLPDITIAEWEVQAGTTVSAGLSENFIPLAVKELNNIAYIISVDPTQDPPVGELGTFPSPDYKQFVYKEGDILPGVITIGAGEYDATSDSKQFAFDVTPTSSETESISGAGIDVVLVNTFRITHKGYDADGYKITTVGANVDIECSVNGGSYVAHSILTPVYLYNYNEYMDVRFIVPNAIVHEPLTVISTVATVKTVGLATEKTYSFSFETSVVFFGSLNGIDWFTVVSAEIPAAGGDVSFSMKTNSSNVVAIINNVEGIPVWLTTTMPVPPSDQIGDIHPLGSGVLELTAAVNEDVGSRAYTILVYDDAAVTAETVEFEITQLASEA